MLRLSLVVVSVSHPLAVVSELLTAVAPSIAGHGLWVFRLP